MPERPKVKMGILRRLWLILLTPYFIFKSLPPKIAKNFLNPFRNYTYTDKKPLTNRKKLAISKQYSFDKFRTFYKQYKDFTFNDLCWTLLLRAINKWSLENNKEPLNTMQAIMPISGRLSLAKGEMGNCSAGRIVYFNNANKYIDNFDDTAKYTSRVLKEIKDKTIAVGIVMVENLLFSHIFSEGIMRSLGKSSFETLSFLFTNVPASSEQIVLNTPTKTKILDNQNFIPHGKIPFNFICLTFNNTARFSFTSDQKGPQVDKILEYMEEEIENLIYNSK